VVLRKTELDNNTQLIFTSVKSKHQLLKLNKRNCLYKPL